MGKFNADTSRKFYARIVPPSMRVTEVLVVLVLLEMFLGLVMAISE